MCVNHCGGKFHSEVAKFRFLNELIKVLSPKVSVPAWPCACLPCRHPLPRGQPACGHSLRAVQALGELREEAPWPGGEGGVLTGWSLPSLASIFPLSL